MTEVLNVIDEPPRSRQAVVRGLRTNWLEAGADDAPIILLLHGFPDTAKSWDYQIPHLGERFHVIAPNARGAGGSAPAPALGRYGSLAQAMDVVEILRIVDPKGARPVLLVGHDLGAAIAMQVVRLAGKRVRGLVIINGLSLAQFRARCRSPKQLAKSWYMFLMQVPVLPETLGRAFPKPLLRFAHRLGGLAKEQRPEEKAIAAAAPHTLKQYRAFLRELVRAGDREPRLKQPVLVLWGKDDAFLMPPTAEEWEAVAETFKIRILRGNHWLHRENPSAVNDLIATFYQEILADD